MEWFQNDGLEDMVQKVDQQYHPAQLNCNVSSVDLEKIKFVGILGLSYCNLEYNPRQESEVSFRTFLTTFRYF